MTPPARRTLGDVVDDRGSLIVSGIVAAQAVFCIALLLIPRGWIDPAVIVALPGITGLLGTVVILWLTAVACGAHIAGCCRACDGDGAGGTARVESHGGLCWDCQGTGHPHVRSWWHR